MATFESSLKARLVYVYAIPDEAHHDCLKIGETTLSDDGGYDLSPNSESLNAAAHKRIIEQTRTAGVAYQLLYTESSIFVRNGAIANFNDNQVHSVLERSGIKKKEFVGVDGAEEWYCCDLETIKKAIAALKQGRDSLQAGEITTGQTPIVFRPEQRAAIDKTRKRFQRYNKMLWNAKMRFGKTLSALQVVKEEGFRRTIILTHRPVVDEQWFDDFNKIFYDTPTYRYGSRDNGESFSSLEILYKRGESYVYFASMQDLRGSEQVGGKFDKNNEIFSTDWDLVIVDEAHEGTQTELGKSVISELWRGDTKLLELSGTPFNLFDNYTEEEIYTWDYVMEQKAKQDWYTDNPYEPNPYASLPSINIYTYDLGKLMSDFADEEKAFNFREFFRTKEDGTFIYNRDVDNFLNLLCKEDKDSLYPYSNEEFRRIFRHTLWVVPGVKSAKALSAKLQEHPVFGGFEIVNVAGDGDDDVENADALRLVEKAIGKDPGQTWTITLSCGRLTTGVTVKPWTAVFMLSGSFSTSAAQYMQTIFRVQSPFEYKGRMKEQCYAFDFAPDRTLRVLAETAKVNAKAGKQTEEDRKTLGDFLNFCPIISIEGSQMKEYDVNTMMSQLKRAQIEKVVQCGFEDATLYNDELLKLTDVELRDFEKLKGIIGKTKAMAKTSNIDVNQQGLTNEQYQEKEKLEKKKKKELTPEEKARLDELKALGNQRREAISILRGISIRMPLLIYGAELTNEDEEITIENFASIVDDTSWDEFMPRGVDKETFEKFRKYYDPDIFREAGKRIRAMARAADKFTIEERIERIAGIFNTFRNPDKETVLTPWRVVNMHMSDCLGGWCFYDEEFKQMLSEPRHVNQGKVTKDVFRPEAHILEINSKSGLYPLYVAYSIYRSRLEAAKQKYGEVPHSFALSLWDATIEENILVVCKTPMAKSITKRTLAGFRNTKVNAKYYKDLIKNISEMPAVVVNTFRDGKRFWKINQENNMRIDAVVGNPPYQVMDGGNNVSAKPVYQHFVSFAKKLKPSYVSMIMPAKWYNGGKGLDDFRTDMLRDNHIAKLYDFIDGHDCFPTVDIAGGICYFLRDVAHQGLCTVFTQSNGSRLVNERVLNSEDVFIRHIEELSILAKVKNEKSFLNIYPRKPFGLATDVKPTKDGDIRIRYNGGVGPFKREQVNVNADLIGKWKVIASYLTAEHAGETDKNGQKRIISTLEILEPQVVCSETYLLLAYFNNKEEATNFYNYIRTKFVRFLINMITATQHLSRTNFRFVPLQDFTKPWTDEELYKKYNLTEEEINFIESMIKPME